MAFDAEITEKSRDKIMLERGRARIARGWVQVGGEGRVGLNGTCMIIACVNSGGGYGCNAAKLLGFRDDLEAYAWNDAPTTTHEMVLARFDEAIARL